MLDKSQGLYRLKVFTFLRDFIGPLCFISPEPIAFLHFAVRSIAKRFFIGNQCAGTLSFLWGFVSRHWLGACYSEGKLGWRVSGRNSSLNSVIVAIAR